MISTAVADQRVVLGAPAELEVFFTDQNGEPTSAGGGGTRGGGRADGTELIAPSTSATDDTSNNAGRYTYALPVAGTELLDLLTVTWTAASGAVLTTRVEVVGGVYFTVAEARKKISSLVEPNYPSAAIVEQRMVLEVEFEDVCGVAFVPRYRRVCLPIRERCVVRLPDWFVRTVRSMTLDQFGTLTPLTDELATLDIRESGVVTFLHRRRWLPCGARLIVEYEHGLDRPPRDVKEVGFTRLRELLNTDSSAIPDRATSYVAEGGTAFRLDTADVDGPANPEIRAVLARNDYRRIPGG